MVRMGQVGLRGRRPWLRIWGHLWMYSLRWQLALRWPWHRSRHHLRVLLGYISLRSLVALGYLRSRLKAVLLVWLQLTWKWLLVLGRNTRLMGHISMWVALLGLKRRLGTRNSPWSRLVSPRQRVLLWLLLLLWLGCRSWGRAMNGHS